MDNELMKRLPPDKGKTGMANLKLRAYLQLAVEAAYCAGKMLAEKKGSLIEKEDGHDIKLMADKESEQLIFDKLEASAINILSEERGVCKKNDDPLWWIVDPLDGSLNYQRHLPLCCISIALWKGDDPVFGVVYDFNRDRLYTGIVGEGAYLDGNRINVSYIEEKSKAIIATGFPVYMKFDDKVLSDFVRKLQDYKKVRLFGSAALSCMMVAQGSVEVYSESNIALWDVAAGIAIIMAAGGRCIYTFTDRERYLLDVFAANNEIDNPKPEDYDFRQDCEPGDL